MKFTAHFFLKKLDLKATEGQNLGALSADFADLKVAIEETKEEACRRHRALSQIRGRIGRIGVMG
jgi:hypothetical protein